MTIHRIFYKNVQNCIIKYRLFLYDDRIWLLILLKLIVILLICILINQTLIIIQFLQNLLTGRYSSIGRTVDCGSTGYRFDPYFLPMLLFIRYCYEFYIFLCGVIYSFYTAELVSFINMFNFAGLYFRRNNLL